jgi:hypothetical protein
MPRRKTIKYDGNPWPDSWEVSFTWSLPEGVGTVRGIRELETRKHEIALKGHPSTWLLFDRYVHNTDNGAVWVDAFEMHPHNCFTSFRPEQIVKVRVHVPPKKKKSLTETVDTRGAT